MDYEEEEDEIEWSPGDDIGFGKHERNPQPPEKSYNEMVRDMNRRGGSRHRTDSVRRKLVGDYDGESVRQYLEEEVCVDWEGCSPLDLRRDLKRLNEMGVEVSYSGIDKNKLVGRHKGLVKFLMRDLGIDGILRQKSLFD